MTAVLTKLKAHPGKKAPKLSSVCAKGKLVSPKPSVWSRLQKLMRGWIYCPSSKRDLKLMKKHVA